mmetsp:Transcript_25313/g.62321  ORF Transcript_25313/g.62321 Transcript_25313/m.62321 type:complete len:308 (-) Transcript_25313:107-1030(-)
MIIRTLTSFLPVIIGLLWCCLTPTHADESMNGTQTNKLQPDTGDPSPETNGSRSDLNSTTLMPSEPPSSIDTLSWDSNESNSTIIFSSPKVQREYEISFINKFIVFVFGAAVIVSILLLIKNHREHTNQLAELRRQQQERRLRDESRREEALRDRRKKEFWQRFHFTVISEDGALGEQQSSNHHHDILFVKKQDSHERVMIEDDVESQTAEETSSSDDSKEDHDTNKCHQFERRPSTSNFFANLWKNNKEQQKENECSICLGDYCPGDTICVARACKCNHVFHQDCIAEWLKAHDECPLCRVNLMSD